MPVSFSRVSTLPNICGIELAFTGTLKPSNIEGYQLFSNSIPQGTDFQKAHYGKATVNFEEKSETSSAGTSYRQKLSIRFPASDKDRADRIAQIHNVKYIKIKFSNSKDLVLGRNDFEQNARPKVKTDVDERLAQVEFETVSISPAGFMPAADGFGLPTLFPISFINPEQ
jgi:hypothetical protein